MEFTKKQMSITKGVAILFMLLLHLFCTKDYIGLFTPLVMIVDTPLIYYFALFGDMCVAIYCFCSGYGLMIGYKNNRENYFRKNLMRIFKLYINFWIILILFVVILGSIMGKSDIYPGSMKDFILTFTAIDPKYNGAWWFLTTYIIFVFVSPFINEVVIKHNLALIIILSLGIYLVGYIQRIMVPIQTDSEVINYILRQAALFGTSQFPYVVGVIFVEKKLHTKISNMFNKIKFKNVLAISLILMMVVAHGFVQTLFVAVFTGIVFIVLFNLIDKPKWLDNVLDYISTHSTNMWLIHMFFYMIYFKDLVFAPKYPVLIFMWLVVLCIIASTIVNIIYKPIINFVEVKFNRNKAVS